MWPVLLTAGIVSVVNLTLLALAAAGFVRRVLPVMQRLTVRAPYWGVVAVVGSALVALLTTTTAQIALWAAAFVLCGEFADFEDAFYHSAVNFTTLGYGDIVMSRQWRLLGPLEAVNGSLMLGLSAAMLFAVLNQVVEAYRNPVTEDGGHRSAS